MKRPPPPLHAATDRAPPNPLCPLCQEHQACPFHAAKSPQDLARAFVRATVKRGSIALVDFLAWALTNVEAMIPDAVLQGISRMDMEPIQQEFAELLDREAFDSDDLRRLAAVCMASALITEHQEAEEDDAENDAPQERRAHPHRKR